MSGAFAGAVALLAGCGGQPFSSALDPGARNGPGAARLLNAVAHVSDAKTARISMNMRVEDLGAGVTVAGSGVIDFRKRRAAMTMRVLSGERRVTAEVRAIDGVVWTNNGSGWSSEPGAASDSTGSLTSDPTNFLTYLRGVANDVREIGQDSVRGIDTTKYSATIDMRRAVERSDASADERAKVQQALDLVGDLHMPVNVWIDAQDRVRKFEVEMDLSGAMKKAGMQLDMRARISIIVEFHDFGVPVDVKTPVAGGGRSTSG